MAKFLQYPELTDFLLATHDRILVEASPVDKICGIGMVQDHEHIQDPPSMEGAKFAGFCFNACSRTAFSSISLY